MSNRIETSLLSLPRTQVPAIHPDGLAHDSILSLYDLSENSLYVHSREPLVFNQQLRADPIPTHPVYTEYDTIPTLYDLSKGETVAYVEKEPTSVVERMSLVKLVYADKETNEDTTTTPQAMTRYDLCGNPLLVNTILPVIGFREDGYTVRLFSVAQADGISLTDISNALPEQTDTDISLIQSIELDHADPSYSWVLDIHSGLVVFTQDAPSLSTHDVYIQFTRYIGANVQQWNYTISGEEYLDNPEFRNIYRDNGAVLLGKDMLDVSTNILEISGNVATVGALTVDGRITATDGVLSFSDRRLKTNVFPVVDAMDKIDKMNGVYYTMHGHRHVGLIAQEVMDIFPEAVSKHTNGYYALEYGNLVGVLVEGMKELRRENRALRERVNALESIGCGK